MEPNLLTKTEHDLYIQNCAINDINILFNAIASIAERYETKIPLGQMHGKNLRQLYGEEGFDAEVRPLLSDYLLNAASLSYSSAQTSIDLYSDVAKQMIREHQLKIKRDKFEWQNSDELYKRQFGRQFDSMEDLRLRYLVQTNLKDEPYVVFLARQIGI